VVIESEVAKSHRHEWMSAPEIYCAFRKHGMLPQPLWDRARGGLAVLHFERMVVTPRFHPQDREVTDDGAVPDWFWQCSGRPPNRDNWISGNLIRHGRAGGRQIEVALYGFGFDVEAVQKFVPLDAREQASGQPKEARKPIRKLLLENWLEGLIERVGGADNLPPVDVIWEAAQARYPECFVSRDAIRAIVPRRKPGKKPLRDNRTA
jgi:hypothetical protein